MTGVLWRDDLRLIKWLAMSFMDKKLEHNKEHRHNIDDLNCYLHLIKD